MKVRCEREQNENSDDCEAVHGHDALCPFQTFEVAAVAVEVDSTFLVSLTRRAELEGAYPFG